MTGYLPSAAVAPAAVPAVQQRHRRPAAPGEPTPAGQPLPSRGAAGPGATPGLAAGRRRADPAGLAIPAHQRTRLVRAAGPVEVRWHGLAPCPSLAGAGTTPRREPIVPCRAR